MQLWVPKDSTRRMQFVEPFRSRVAATGRNSDDAEKEIDCLFKGVPITASDSVKATD